MIGKIIELIDYHQSKQIKEFQKPQPLSKTKRRNSGNVLKTKCHQSNQIKKFKKGRLYTRQEK